MNGIGLLGLVVIFGILRSIDLVHVAEVQKIVARIELTSFAMIAKLLKNEPCVLEFASKQITSWFFRWYR
jgi:hypothetical protein